jgi:hypothetical protein
MCELCQVPAFGREMSVAKRIGAALGALLWAFCGYFGWELGGLYVVFPVTMMLLGIGLVAFSKRTPMVFYVTVLAVEIVLIPPFLMIYGGDV